MQSLFFVFLRMHYRIYILFFLLFACIMRAQLDLEHWFPPYYRSSPNDISVIVIHISTDKAIPFPVKIYNNNIEVGQVTVSKDKPVAYVPASSVIEASTIQRTMRSTDMGIHLSGAQSFYASLRIAGCRVGCKSEVVSSKGKSALGTEFDLVMDKIILYGNSSAGMNYQASIMATQDNTHIKLSDYDERLVFVNGHSDKELNFTLNRGQSYIILARKQDNTNSSAILDDNDPNLIGAHVSSDKPVVINNGNFISQDLGEVNGNINLDQTIPTNKIGKEYFVVNGMTRPTRAMEKVLIVAPSDNTEIFFNSETVATVVLNKGEHYLGPYGKTKFITGNQASFTNPEPIQIPTSGMFIHSSKPIYLYQMIGGYDFRPLRLETDVTTDTSAMTLSFPIDKPYYPAVQQNLNNILTIPEANKIGGFTGNSKLSIKTKIDAEVQVNGVVLSNPSPINGKDGWGYYSLVPIAGDVEIQSNKDLNVDVVGGFEYTGYASSYTGFSNDPYILINGNCIQENVFLKLSNRDFISFQWQLNGVDIPGANNYEYQPVIEGSYQCVVTYTGFSFTTAPVFIPNCPYNIYDVNIGSVCHSFEIEPKFTQTGHVFSKIEIFTQPNNGIADISARKILVKMNDSFAGSDRLIYKLTATDGYYEVYKANFTVLQNPIADVKTELQPKSFLEDTYYFDLFSAINNENNETFQFFPTYIDAEKNEDEIKESLSNYSSISSEVYIKVTNQDNCFLIKKIILTKPPIIPDSVSLPNAFSPNNDGINDFWDYSLLNALQDIELKIYDRYGKLVYMHTNNFFWNGKVNGKVLQSDSYWVVYSYTSKGLRVSNKTMWLLLKNI